MSDGPGARTIAARKLARGLAVAVLGVAVSGAFIQIPIGTAHAESSGVITIDNATGKKLDGSDMQSPGLDNRDVDGYYYSIGATQLDISSGGEYTGQTLWLYRGEDWQSKRKFQDAPVLGPDTEFVDEHGVTTHPVANAKLERISFTRAKQSDGSYKYAIWSHWEMKADYSASHVLIMTADKAEGPYKITSSHARPGASLGVDADGRNGTSDYAEAMGERVGQLKADWDTADANGDYAVIETPASGRDYPQTTRQWVGPSAVCNQGDINTWIDCNYSDSLSRQGTDAYGYAGAVDSGDWWTDQMGDLSDTLTLKATAVRMTEFDDTAYRAAKQQMSGWPSAQKFIVRYPALKGGDKWTAAGVSAQGYEGKLGVANDYDGITDPADLQGGDDPGTQPALAFTNCGISGLAFNVTFQEGSTGASACDNNANSVWSTWPKADSAITYQFADGFVTASKVAVTFQEQAPDGILVEGRTASEGWKTIGSTSVNQTLGFYEVPFDSTVAVDQIRVTMQGQWMKAKEVTLADIQGVGKASIEGIT
jgi:hypothetical protein